MYQKLSKYGVTAAFVTGAVISVIFFILALNGVSGVIDTVGSDYSNKDLSDKGFFDFGLYATYFLLAASVVVTIGFFIYAIATNPKEYLKIIIAIVGVVVLYFVFKSAMGSDEVTDGMIKMGVDGATGKMIDGMLYTTYAVLGAALLAFLGTNVLSIVKNR